MMQWPASIWTSGNVYLQIILDEYFIAIYIYKDLNIVLPIIVPFAVYAWDVGTKKLTVIYLELNQSWFQRHLS